MMAKKPRSAIVGISLILIAALIVVSAVVVGLTRSSDDANSNSTAAPSITPSPEETTEPGTEPGSELPEMEFVTAKDATFWVGDEPFRYAGTNNFTLMYSDAMVIDAFMQQMVESELTVVRAWAFYDNGTPSGDLGVEGNQRGIYFHYWDPETNAPAYNEGPTGLERLDYLVYSARQHDIRLVLPFVNNWTNFGGMDQYVRWAGGANHEDFILDERIKQWYKDWVEMLLERENVYTGVKYKDEPAIMAWELANEMRCSSSGPYPSGEGCTAENINAWVDEMSTFVKSIDSKHLLGFGGEGFLCSDPGGDDWITNCTESGDPVAIVNMPNIDMNGIHVYPNHWNPTQPTTDWKEWAAWFIGEHGKIANDAGKPFFIGEYGWLDLTERSSVFDYWLEAFDAAGGDGSHFWIMQPASSIAQPPDGVGFTQRCPGTACSVVTKWSLHMRDGLAMDSFAPEAENDVVTIEAGTQVSIDVLHNDVAYGSTTFVADTIDLDPTTAGRQLTFSNSDGLFEYVDGKVLFTPNPDFHGTTRAAYTVENNNGLVSNEARITVTVR